MSDTPRTDEAIDCTSQRIVGCIPTIISTSRQLERELNAAKARAEKAEALSSRYARRVHSGENLENCPFCQNKRQTPGVPNPMCHLCDLESIIESARDDAKRAASDRDALRKALEPFSDLLDGLDNEHDNAPIEIEVSIMERGVFTVGDLRRAHAALHCTAKQNPIDSFASKFPPGTTFIQTEPAADAAPSPKPLVCGDCADRMTCAKYGHRYPGDFACNDFQPRADAQKGST